MTIADGAGTVTLIDYRPFLALLRETKPLKMHMATIGVYGRAAAGSTLPGQRGVRRLLQNRPDPLD